jgi:hypothetical protein
MPSLCLLTVPGLEVSSDWRLVHDRLLDEFPEVTDVLATTTKGTILVTYEDPAPGDAGRWLDAVSETILHCRRSRGTPRRVTQSHRGQFARERRRFSRGAHRSRLGK